ncbi:MAG: universal stress protein [Devosia sp.]|uniref:universal stress protein n=1 Tax=Devosia sp. TaxID=1871048 RepID=UPI0019FFCE88|nr:universal stress protein [Devosia sp.]MBF0680086.1 universal stress protein [Devosia sp.]
MKLIMLATDFSERSDRALRRATLLARETGAAMMVVHAVDDDRPKYIVDRDRENAETLLRRLISTLEEVDTVRAEMRVILGEASEAILLAAREETPDLLVIGPHRRQIFRDVFVGTTAERTIRSAQCPTLMANAAPVGSYQHILMTTDLSDRSQDFVAAYMRLQPARSARQSILNVFDAPMLRLVMSHEIPAEEKAAHLKDQRTKASQKLSAFLVSAEATVFKPILRHEVSNASGEILAAASEAGADLVVVGTQSKKGVERFLLGSVAERVLRDAVVDILALPFGR